MKKRYLALASAILISTVLSSGISTVSVQSNGGYDPWVDLNDDGTIDIFDIVAVALAFGATGTPINKTALLLDLQNRIDALNTTLLALQEQMAQLGSVKVLVGAHNDWTHAVTGRVTVWYNASHTNQFVAPPTVFVQAVDPTNGNAKYAEVFSAGLADFVVTIYESVGGALFLDAGVDVTWIAIGTESTSTPQAYANTEVLQTWGTGTITINFPFNFSSAPALSVEGTILSGTNLGKPLWIQNIATYTDHATMDLQYYDAGGWTDLGSGVHVQVSYTAVENRTG